MQSSLYSRGGLHVAIIMDGNGRWASRQGLPRTEGHRAGIRTVRRIAEGAADLGVATLTLFAFSADNWRRPAAEVAALMWLLRAYLRSDLDRLAANGTRLSFIGRRDRLSAGLRREIAHAEQATRAGRRLHVRVALDYSSRVAIAEVAARWAALPAPSLDLFGRLVAGDDPGVAAVDLLDRTGGEKRLSDFLLWELAYAELWFTDMMWPEFGTDDLCRAITEFNGRERRFGGLVGALPQGASARLQGTAS